MGRKFFNVHISAKKEDIEFLPSGMAIRRYNKYVEAIFGWFSN